MKTTSISISEGKKGFSHFIQNTSENNNEIIVTKRGKPVAAIIPYEEYQHSKRIDGYRKIMESRSVFLKTGLKATEIFAESKSQLEKKP